MRTCSSARKIAGGGDLGEELALERREVDALCHPWSWPTKLATVILGLVCRGPMYPHAAASKVSVRSVGSKPEDDTLDAGYAALAAETDGFAAFLTARRPGRQRLEAGRVLDGEVGQHLAVDGRSRPC